MPSKMPGIRSSFLSILASLVLLLVLGSGLASASVLTAVAFEENRGQLPQEILFATRSHGFGIVAYAGSPAIRTRLGDEVVELRLRFFGGDASVAPLGEERLAGHVNYFRGDDPSEWATGIPRYGRIRYVDVYPGIDAVLHERDGAVELDFEIAPDADPSQVSLAFDGIDRVDIDAEGRLVLVRGDERFTLSAPEIYQRRDGRRDYLKGWYEIEEARRVDFAMSRFDRARALVIEPVFLGFSTRIGGTGDDRVGDLATDPAGNL